MRRIGIALFICFIIGALSLYLRSIWSPGAPTYREASAAQIALTGRFRTWPEHDAIVKQFGRPYILTENVGKGALTFYGAKHVHDPNDPQLADIEKRWAEFKPTVALHEGRSRGFFIGPPFVIKSEVTLVHKLARRDDVPMYSLEPAYEDEVRQLLTRWSPEQVALYFTMRVYWGESGGKADEGLAEHLRKKRTNVEGLRGSLASVADIDRVWKRDLARFGDWRTLREEPRESYLAEIADDSRRIRGEHMARTIIDLTRRGERVFAVVGSGHVIRLEWIVREGVFRGWGLGTRAGSGLRA